MLVLGGGNRFYFYANKKVNYRHEKQNYKTFTKKKKKNIHSL